MISMKKTPSFRLELHKGKQQQCLELASTQDDKCVPAELYLTRTSRDLGWPSMRFHMRKHVSGYHCNSAVKHVKLFVFLCSPLRNLVVSPQISSTLILA